MTAVLALDISGSYILPHVWEDLGEKKIVVLGQIFLSVPSRGCSSCFSNDGTKLNITE